MDDTQAAEPPSARDAAAQGFAGYRVALHEAAAREGAAHRRELKIKLAWAFLAKLLSLALLWYLFFRR
jgi:hypothetical protein